MTEYLKGFIPYKGEDAEKYNKYRYWAGLTFGDILDRAADIHPEKEAFIDGVSRSWLELVEQTAQRNRPAVDDMSVTVLQDDYRTIDKEVQEAWETQGRHAFLHHLNAIFGYAPVVVYEKKYMKF